MKSLIEKILIYILGGISGVIIGFIFINLDIYKNIQQDISGVVVLFNVIIFVLISIIIQNNFEIKLLRKNAELRNETVSLITHEMRTGLTATGWVIQIVLQKYKDLLEKTDREMLEGVASSVRITITHSVNLLDVSMIDIGKLAISLEKVSLADIEKLFNEILMKFSYGAKIKGIKVTSKVELDKKREIEVDMVRLRIVLDSLLENSLQYTINEKKEVDISINNDNNYLFIKVSDTGIGIPEADQKNIFKEFYRANNARAALSSGSGIGLYSSAQYVKAHNGTITFDSVEGAGTTFKVKIPLTTRLDVNKFLESI